MSRVPFETASATDEPLVILLFDHPGADIVLCSQNSYHFRVPKIYIANSSPILGELIHETSNSPGDADAEASLPVVQLPESSEILRCLLTFILPITPLLPSTSKVIMELLSVAQKYEMETALTHIRGCVARQNSLPTRLEPALHIYALAQTYGLRPEALQAAQVILLKQSMTIQGFSDNLDIMSGASLYELRKYYERVRDILVLDLAEFRMSCARGTITGLCCTELSLSQIPCWLDQYIHSIGDAPNFFDPGQLNIAMARHIKDKAQDLRCECASIPSQTISDFWDALGSVVLGGFEKVSVVDMPSYLGC
jgi:BTB/POZ domain